MSAATLAPDDGMVVVTDAVGRGARKRRAVFPVGNTETGWMSRVRAAAIDSFGQVYFATDVGIQMCEANGRVAAILHQPRLRGVAFGGEYLYAAT